MPSSSQTGTPPHVLASKLSPPVPQPGAVGRHELVQTLEVAPTTSLRVVVAPAGWGKSALLAHWLRGHARPVAYVALDRGDTDAARCWAHILEAIGRATGVAVGDLQTSLRAPGLDMIAEVVEPLMVHLEAADVTIVLDDLHLASSAEVIESIESLADIRPPGVGLAVASRIDPPLHLPRRRVRQELVEIRLADLRLEVPDATAVLGAAAGHTVDPSIVAALTELTEGWPAGLYLAGLALRASQDDHDVAARFAADDRHLSEYLATEVIAALPDDDRAFLTQTSVLGELDPVICDAMTGTGGSASRLERLAATNLFVIPVEGRAGTYRYHHLFGQWLQAELASAGPEAVADAHELAARALSEAGRPDEAAAQAVASGRAVPAYGALLRAAIGMLDSGHHATLAELAGALPPPPTASRQFDVEILRAWSSIVDGDLDAVERFSQGARDALESGELDPGRYARRGELRLLAAYRHLLRGSIDEAAETLDLATHEGVASRADASAAFIATAVEYWQQRSTPQSQEAALATAQRAQDPYAQLLIESCIAHDLLDHGDEPGAREWIESAFATAGAHGLGSFGYLAAAHAASARADASVGQLDQALVAAHRGIELADRRGDVPFGCLARIVSAQVCHISGDGEEARRLLATVEEDLERISGADLLTDRFATVRRQLRLQQPAVVRRDFERIVEELTDRETAILNLLPGEMTQREIGAALHMSFNTVKSYNRQIYRKLGVSSRDEAVEAAKAHGLL